MKTHHHATEGHEHGEESVSGHSNPRAGQSNAERAAQLSTRIKAPVTTNFAP